MIRDKEFNMRRTEKYNLNGDNRADKFFIINMGFILTILFFIFLTIIFSINFSSGNLKDHPGLC